LVAAGAADLRARLPEPPLFEEAFRADTDRLIEEVHPDFEALEITRRIRFVSLAAKRIVNLAKCEHLVVAK
jgi:hypothetical protein